MTDVYFLYPSPHFWRAETSPSVPTTTPPLQIKGRSCQFTSRHVSFGHFRPFDTLLTDWSLYKTIFVISKLLCLYLHLYDCTKNIRSY